MMNRSRFRAAVAAALVTLMPAAYAESIGRTEVDLSAQPWSALTTFQSSLNFDAGARTIPLTTKVFYIPGPTAEPLALLVITSTEGGHDTNVRWLSEICPPARKNFYADDFETNKQTRTRQCLIINSSFAPYIFYKADSEILAAANAKGIVLFRSGYSIRSVYGAPGGSILRVNLMTKRSFMGLPAGGLGTSNPYEVPEALVGWGQALQKAVQTSVLSLSGKLELPPISFTP